MVKRIVATLTVALMLASLCIATLSFLEKRQGYFQFITLSFVIIPLNLAPPLTVCGLVFYSLVKKVKKINVAAVLSVTWRFTLVCQTLCALWTVIPLTSFGHWRGFWNFYHKNFLVWHGFVLLIGVLVPFLYYNRHFLARLKRR